MKRKVMPAPKPPDSFSRLQCKKAVKRANNKLQIM